MRPIRTWLAIVACAGVMHASKTSAQNWADFGLPGEFIDWGDFYLDTTTNELYATGINRLYPGGPTGVYVRQNGAWDTLGLFWGSLRSVIRYNDTLIVAGNIWSEFQGDSISRIAYLSSTGWQPYGTIEQSINMLRVIDGELYAVGGFETVDGQPCDGIAKRVGGHWEPVGDFGEVLSFPYLFDVIKYQGKLVTCGNMSIVGETYRDVYVFENGEWGPLGGGLYGAASGGWEMTIYNGELILGGNFYLNAGNAGQSIMRWNGSIWQPLGEGLTDITDSHTYAPQVYALKVHDGKLFVGGGFFHAGHVPAISVATWDGDVWCGLGSDPNTVHDIEFYGDTLLIMCNNNWIDGEYNSGGVRYLHTTYDDTCSASTLTVPDQLGVVPRAFFAEGQLHVNGLKDGPSFYTVTDPAGRIMQHGTLNSSGGRCAPITLGSIASGVYLLQVFGQIALRFVVPE